ncbi:VF530 family DNA-binding protein [Pontiellaceae bacterium B1224]|nr:VF530 family DNA-binding protein [Pontiellaceae bacterium B1224]
MPKENLQNSPLHGLSAETMLTELVEFYGWEVLDAAIDLKCLRIQPTIPSCLTFLKKAEWARNRVEDFYLYQFKQMPKPSAEEQELKPRERGFPVGVQPKKPKPLTVKTAMAERAEDIPEPKPQKRPPRYEDPEAPAQESTFKSRFSNSRFRK